MKVQDILEALSSSEIVEDEELTVLSFYRRLRHFDLMPFDRRYDQIESQAEGYPVLDREPQVLAAIDLALAGHPDAQKLRHFAVAGLLIIHVLIDRPGQSPLDALAEHSSS